MTHANQMTKIKNTTINVTFNIPQLLAVRYWSLRNF